MGNVTRMEPSEINGEWPGLAANSLYPDREKRTMHELAKK